MKLTLEGRDCNFLNFFKEPFGDKIPLGGEEDKFEFHWRHLAEDIRKEEPQLEGRIYLKNFMT